MVNGTKFCTMTRISESSLSVKSMGLCVCVCVCVLFSQSYLTLCDSMDRSLSRFYVHGNSQTRILEWVVMPFSRGSSRLSG